VNEARTRATLLMALSNKFGNILLNTSNKSETAVGYGTLYGDMSGGLSVLGDVYKTDVYLLAQYMNQKREVIPVNIINKPPSAVSLLLLVFRRIFPNLLERAISRVALVRA